MRFRLLFILPFIITSLVSCTSKEDAEPYFDYEPKYVELSAEGGTFEIAISTNVDYTCEVQEDWIAEIAPVSKDTHRFKVMPNKSEEPRASVVTMCANNLCMMFRVNQLGVEHTDQDDGSNGGGDSSSNEGSGDEGENGGDNSEGGNTQDGNVNWSASFKHRSLALRFTADWCGDCPNLATAFEQAKTALSGDLEIVSMHGSGSNLYYSSLMPYYYRFQVSGFPTGIVDARANILNYSPVSYPTNAAKNVVMETVSAHPTKTGIAISSTLQGRKVTADVQIYVKEADSYKVYALILEDDIVGYQNGGGNSYDHDHIARVQLSSASGDPMEISTGNTIWTKTYSADIPTSYNISNMRILVYVEKPYGNQSKVNNVSYVEYGNYGDTYVDNSRSVKVGTTGSIEII